jgi:hypothetical protein
VAPARTRAWWHGRGAVENCRELCLSFLVANAEAFAKGLTRLEMNFCGLPYALAPFKYYEEIRALYATAIRKGELGYAGRVASTGGPAKNSGRHGRAASWSRQ